MNVKTLCLGILTLEDASGYEIKKSFENRFSQVFDAGFSSIYPALQQLTKDGLVSCREETQDKRPNKKVYSITPEGQKTFIEELKTIPAPDKFRSEALTKLMFADLLPASCVSTLIDTILLSYEKYIEDISAGCDKTRPHSEQFLCGFGLTIRKAAIQYLHDNRHLLEDDAVRQQKAAE
ncbi:PadR family transcriptional regulator [Sneathiella aquimaris]|uniref:PadR family transcriptional regulator n=1 Tax=Sneathiella aquimaris TaxID=2599305 RepID=UPI00146ECC63|nr:PadR family transcriptional regulator [Sneathiella aquimaris]